MQHSLPLEDLLGSCNRQRRLNGGPERRVGPHYDDSDSDDASRAVRSLSGPCQCGRQEDSEAAVACGQWRQVGGPGWTMCTHACRRRLSSLRNSCEKLDRFHTRLLPPLEWLAGVALPPCAPAAPSSALCAGFPASPAAPWFIPRRRRRCQRAIPGATSAARSPSPPVRRACRDTSRVARAPFFGSVPRGLPRFPGCRARSPGGAGRPPSANFAPSLTAVPAESGRGPEGVSAPHQDSSGRCARFEADAAVATRRPSAACHCREIKTRPCRGGRGVNVGEPVWAERAERGMLAACRPASRARCRHGMAHRQLQKPLRTRGDGLHQRLRLSDGRARRGALQPSCFLNTPCPSLGLERRGFWMNVACQACRTMVRLKALKSFADGP